MSSINERYEQFRKSQKGADGSSAYVQNNTNNETPSPIGVNVNSNPVKDRKNEAVILEGGAITTRGLYEQQRRVEQKAYADSKRAYISETKRLEAQGYTRSSVDPKTGEETWTRKQQAQERAADLATVAQKKTYTPLEQAYRGAVQYNVAPFSGFAAQLGDVTGNKGLSQGAKDFEKTLKFDQNPAVGPLSGVLDLASLGFANLTGDRKGQIEAKRKLAYDFSSIKERPYEYGAASATDAAGLLVGATEIKGAAKAGTTAATQALGKLKSFGASGAKQGSHFIPEAMATSYKGAQAADALKIMKPSGPKAPNRVSEALSMFSPTNRKLASAERQIRTTFPDSRGFQKVGDGKAVFDIALEEKAGASKYVGGVVDVKGKELRLATRQPQDAKSLAQTADSPFTKSVADIRMTETTGLKKDFVTKEGNIIDSSGNVRKPAEPRSIGAVESYDLGAMMRAMPKQSRIPLFGAEKSKAATDPFAALGAASGGAGRKAGNNLLDFGATPTTAAENKALNDVLFNFSQSPTKSGAAVGSKGSQITDLSRSGAIIPKSNLAFGEESTSEPAPSEPAPSKPSESESILKPEPKKPRRLRDEQQDLISINAADRAFWGSSNSKSNREKTGLNLLDSSTQKLKDNIDSKQNFGFFNIPAQGTTTKPTSPTITQPRTPFSDLTNTPTHTTTPRNILTVPTHTPDTKDSIITIPKPQTSETSITIPTNPWNFGSSTRTRPPRHGGLFFPFGGGGSFVGGSGKPLGGTSTRGLGVKNAFSSAFDIAPDGKRNKPLSITFGRTPKGKNAFGKNVFAASGAGRKGRSKSPASLLGGNAYSFGRSTKRGKSIWA